MLEKINIGVCVISCRQRVNIYLLRFFENSLNLLVYVDNIKRKFVEIKDLKLCIRYLKKTIFIKIQLCVSLGV